MTGAAGAEYPVVNAEEAGIRSVISMVVELCCLFEALSCPCELSHLTTDLSDQLIRRRKKARILLGQSELKSSFGGLQRLVQTGSSHDAEAHQLPHDAQPLRLCSDALAQLPGSCGHFTDFRRCPTPAFPKGRPQCDLQRQLPPVPFGGL